MYITCVNILPSIQSHILILKYYLKLHCFFPQHPESAYKTRCLQEDKAVGRLILPMEVQNDSGLMFCGGQRAYGSQLTLQHWGSSCFYQAGF